MTQEQLNQLQKDSDELMIHNDQTESDSFIGYLAKKYNLKNPQDER